MRRLVEHGLCAETATNVVAVAVAQQAALQLAGLLQEHQCEMVRCQTARWQQRMHWWRVRWQQVRWHQLVYWQQVRWQQVRWHKLVHWQLVR